MKQFFLTFQYFDVADGVFVFLICYFMLAAFAILFCHARPIEALLWLVYKPLVWFKTRAQQLHIATHFHPLDMRAELAEMRKLVEANATELKRMAQIAASPGSHAAEPVSPPTPSNPSPGDAAPAPSAPLPISVVAPLNPPGRIP